MPGNTAGRGWPAASRAAGTRSGRWPRPTPSAPSAIRARRRWRPSRRRRWARRRWRCGCSRDGRRGHARAGGDSGALVSEAPAMRAPPAEARAVSRLTLWRVFWRSLFLQASWNPRGMQNIGFADAIGPALDELYPDRAARARAGERHLEFFNCHPYLAAPILGGAVRLEEKVAQGQLAPERVSSFKSALGPPFAALGDGFFWLA